MAETAETKVAEGPLIRHTPGGYAEFLQRESGLPPARLIRPEGEWWAKLVDTPAPSIKDIVPDTGDTDPTGPTDSPAPGFDPDALTDPGTINWDYYDDPKIEPYGWKTDYEPIDWSTDFEIPKGYGWGTSDSTLPYTGGLGIGDPRTADPPITGPQLPKGPEDRLGVGYKEPIVIRHPRPPKGETIQNIGRASGDKPFIPYRESDTERAIGGIKGVVTDALGGVVSMSDAVLGKTQYDQYPRPPKEKALGRLLGKWKDLMEGKAEEGLLLWETQGVPSSLGNRTPFGPDYVDTLKNLDKIIKNEHNIKTQEYGQLQVIAIMNMAKLISMYGPIGAVPATVLTLSKDIMSGFKNAFADHPEFRGNPAQDIIHGTTWVLGQTLEKTYNATLGKVVGKVDGEKLKEKLSKLNIIEYMKAPDVSTGVKITIDPNKPKVSHLEPDHDPLDLRIADKKLISGTPGTPTREMRKPVPTGEIPTAQPIRAEVPTQKPPIPPPPPLTSTYTHIPTEVGQATTKTVTPPIIPPPSSDPDDRLTDEQLAVGPEITEGDPLGGGITGRPTGEPVQMSDEEAQRLGLTPSESDRIYKELGAETTGKLLKQAERESQQDHFKEHGRFSDDATNEAFSKSSIDWLEQGTENFRSEVDTDALGDDIRIGDIERSIGDLEYYYQNLENQIQWSNEYQNQDGTQTTQQRVDQNAALDDVRRQRDGAIGGLQSQINDIHANNAAGVGVKETKETPSAMQIWFNNPDMSAEEAVEEAMRYAQNAQTELTQQENDEMWNKVQNFSHDLTNTVQDQIFGIQQQTQDTEQASNQAGFENQEQEFKEQQATQKANREAFEKQQAEMDAVGKSIMDSVKAYYKKLEEKEPLMAAAGQAQLATKVLYKGKDGGVVAVKDKVGNTVGLVYIDPETKKMVDETMEGYINDDDPYLRQGPGILMESEGGPTIWSPAPEPDEPGP